MVHQYAPITIITMQEAERILHTIIQWNPYTITRSVKSYNALAVLPSRYLRSQKIVPSYKNRSKVSKIRIYYIGYIIVLLNRKRKQKSKKSKTKSYAHKTKGRVNSFQCSFPIIHRGWWQIEIVNCGLTLKNKIVIFF